MPAWPGGPCPECGEDMPSNLVHCQGCRALLNTTLKPLNIHVPEFVPLRELDSPDQLEEEAVAVLSQGYYCHCPQCTKELKISKQFQGKEVACKFCESGFLFDVKSPEMNVNGVVLHCPTCSNKLRVATKYLGLKVLCNFCSQPLVIYESNLLG